MQKTTIVVPCYNEAKRLDTAAFIEALDTRPWLRLIFVDDGSRDATLAVLGEIKSAKPAQVSITSLSLNRGKAETVRRGMLEALETDA